MLSTVQAYIAQHQLLRPGAPVIVADEPTGNLDSRNSDQVMELLSQLNRRGSTVIVVTHDDRVAIEATVRTADRTGVEMEALTAVTVAALTLIDMVKGVDRSAYIGVCGIVAKSGGRSGDWSRDLPR